MNSPRENGNDSPRPRRKDVSLVEKWNEQMKLIERKTGIHGVYVIICLVISILFVYLNIFDNLITNLVGTVYPAFWTMKSIETQGDDDKKWLTYWVVFGSFTIVDMFSGFIVKFVPFYFVLKIIFLIWLFMPNSHGATLVYHLLVIRVFKSFENDIDSAADKVKEYTNEFVLNSDNVEKFNNIKNTFRKANKAMNIVNDLNKTMVLDQSGEVLEKKDLVGQEDDEDTVNIHGKVKKTMTIANKEPKYKKKAQPLKTETNDGLKRDKKRKSDTPSAIGLKTEPNEDLRKKKNK